MRRIDQVVLGLFFALSFGVTAGAKDSGEEVFAIQERIFDRDHEVGLVLGYIPDERFQHAFPAGLDYLFNFNENLAWEVGRAQYFFNVDKDLKEDLEKEFGATPEEFDRRKYSIHTSLLLKPSYGKDALWNRRIVNHETFVALGAGIAAYERETSTGEKSSELAPSLSFGLGRKYFLGPKLCLNLEIRDFVDFKDAGVENHVFLGIGLGYRFNLKPRKPPEDEAAKRLKGYLKEKAE
jgi:outer membrane beta-barrel protein